MPDADIERLRGELVRLQTIVEERSRESVTDRNALHNRLEKMFEENRKEHHGIRAWQQHAEGRLESMEEKWATVKWIHRSIGATSIGAFVLWVWSYVTGKHGS